VKVAIIVAFLFLGAAAFAQEVATAESCEQGLRGYWREQDARKAIVLFKQLKTAVESDDRQAVAGMVFYALRVNGEYRVHNKTAFLRHYDQIFDKKVREALSRQIPECIEGNSRGFRTELGEIWVEAMNYGPMKVIAINNGSWPKTSRTHKTPR
jgi:hypothetical protein